MPHNQTNLFSLTNGEIELRVSGKELWKSFFHVIFIFCVFTYGGLWLLDTDQEEG